MKKGDYIFILLVILFIITRVFIVTSTNNNWGAEECYVGTMANEIAHGTGLSWYEMPFAEYQLGGVVDAYLSSIFYNLGLINGYELKIIPIIYSTIAFIFFYLLTRRFYSKFVNYTASSIFILAPGMFLWMNVINGTGDFLSSIMYTIIAFYILLIIKEKNKGPIWWGLLGLVYGFGFLNNHGVALSLPLVFGFLIIEFKISKKMFKRAGIFVLGFLTGSIPLGIFRIFYNISELNHLFGSFSKISITHFIKKIITITFKEFILSFKSYPILNYTYFALFSISFIICVASIIQKVKKEGFNGLEIKHSFPIGIIILFFLAYSISSFGDVFRELAAGQESNPFYYLIMYPFFFILVAVAIQKLLFKKGVLRIIGTIILVGLLTSGGISLNQKIYPLSLFRVKYAPYCYNGIMDLGGQKGESNYFSSPGQIFHFRWNSNSGRLDSTLPFSLCAKLHSVQRQEECYQIVEYYFNKNNQTIPEYKGK